MTMRPVPNTAQVLAYPPREHPAVPSRGSQLKPVSRPPLETAGTAPRAGTDVAYHDYMFRRKQVAQNEIIACHMRKFFRTLRGKRRRNPEIVARRYGQFLWDNAHQRLMLEEKLSGSRFCVGLSIGDSRQEFGDITKRAILISDTLLLSHQQTETYHDIADNKNPNLWPPASVPMSTGQIEFSQFNLKEILHGHAEWDGHHLEETYGIYCPSLDELGRWILDAEPLLKAGLVWYLPKYGIAPYETRDGVREPLDKDKIAPAAAIDYLIRDGRAVDASGTTPIKSQLVRPVLEVDLPFVDGVSLQDFGKITIGEFASYSAFRDFLRQTFLDMDTALNAVQSERELVKLSLQIKDHVRSVRSEMETARRKGAVSVTGAVIGSVGALLVAVYGPALAEAVAIIGASGGVWGIIHAASENSTHALRQDKWYYVWALAGKSNIHVT